MLALVLAVRIPSCESADRYRLKAGAAKPCKLVQDAEQMLVGFRDDHRGDARLAERAHDELDVAEKRQLEKLKNRAAVVKAVAVMVEKVGLRAVLLPVPHFLKICILSHVRILLEMWVLCAFRHLYVNSYFEKSPRLCAK